MEDLSKSNQDNKPSMKELIRLTNLKMIYKEPETCC
jgi:hypothetical protein